MPVHKKLFGGVIKGFKGIFKTATFIPRQIIKKAKNVSIGTFIPGNFKRTQRLEDEQRGLAREAADAEKKRSRRLRELESGQRRALGGGRAGGRRAFLFSSLRGVFPSTLGGG